MTANVTTAAMTTIWLPHSSLSLSVGTTRASQDNLSVTPDLSNPCPSDDSSLRIPLALLYSLIFILGLAGNLLALWTFFCVQSKKNSVHTFLINTALADLLLVVCLPFRVFYHSKGNHWSLGPTMCNVVGTLFYMNMYISIMLLGLISVNRYLKINHGMGMYRRLQATRWSAATCTIIWVGAFALTLPYFLSMDHKVSSRCFQYKQLINTKWKGYINFFVVIVFWLVFFSLVTSYGRIALKLLRTSRDKPDLPNATRYGRTAKKSFFILFLFTVCFVPYHIVRVFYIISQITDTSCFWRRVANQANEVSLLFSALNSCLDPVMYFLLSSSMRKEVLQLISSALFEREGGASSSSSTVEPESWKNVKGQPRRSTAL